MPQSGDQFSGLTIDTESLKPEKFDNYEIGAKWEPIEGLLATAAIYRLDRTNTRATNPLNPAETLLTGEQRSKGIELGLSAASDRPVADLRGLCLAEGEDHRDHDRLLRPAETSR